MVASGLMVGACGRTKSGSTGNDAAGAAGDGTTGAGGVGGRSSTGTPSTLTAVLLATIPLPGMPTAATYNAGTKKAYFGCQTQAKTSAGLAVVDNDTNAVVTTLMPVDPVTSLVANATTKMVYGVERDQIDVIDSMTDTITAMVQTPDQSAIAGLAVDETHNRIYVIASNNAGAANLYVLDGVLNTLSTPTPVLLTPAGAPPIAVDPVTQKVFVLGLDSNATGLIVTVDGTNGVPQSIESTASKVDPLASGVVSLGDGTAAILLVSPGIVKRLEHLEVALPASFTPTGVAVVGAGFAPSVLVVGFGADGQPQGYGVATSNGTLSPFSLALAGSLSPGTVADQILTGAAIAGGSEFYVDVKPDAASGTTFGPTETIKMKLTTTP
jgi:hypothetical protein